MAQRALQTLMEIQCEEVYTRTLIQCDEATLFQRLSSHWGPFGPLILQTTLGINPHVPIASSLEVAASEVTLPCCSRAELVKGRCEHADSVLRMMQRRRQFEQSEGELSRRIEMSSSNIRRLCATPS